MTEELQARSSEVTDLVSITSPNPLNIGSYAPDDRGVSALQLRFHLLPFLLMSIVVLVAYSPVYYNGFVNFDDTQDIVRNPHIRYPGYNQLLWCLTTFHMGAYRPVCWLLRCMQYSMFGSNPAGYHLVSVLLHLGVTFAIYHLFFALKLICDAKNRSVDKKSFRWSIVLGTLLFAIHPLRVEAVAWATTQAYLLSALFAVLSVNAYLCGHSKSGQNPSRWIVLAYICFSLSAFSVPTAIGLPLILLGIDHYILQRTKITPISRLVWEKWFWFLISLASGVCAYFAKQQANVLETPNLNLFGRLSVISYNVLFHPLKTIVPYGFHVHYAFPQSVSIDDVRWTGAVLLVVLLTSLLVVVRNRCPKTILAITSYLILLAPNSGVVHYGNQLTAERYGYLAPLPLSIWLVVCLTWLESRYKRLFYGVWLLVPCLMILTFWQCQIWHDSGTLWTQVLLFDEKDPLAELDLGNWLLEIAQFRKAEDHLVHASELDPQSSLAQLNLGIARYRQGKVTQAKDNFTNALKLDPQLTIAKVYIGQMLVLQERVDEAAHEFDGARSMRIEQVSTCFQLASGFSKIGRLSDAESQFKRALAIDQDHGPSLLGLGRVLTELGRFDDAILSFNRLIDLSPNDRVARLDLAMLLLTLGRSDQARTHLRYVLRYNPNDPDARRMLQESFFENSR